MHWANIEENTLQHDYEHKLIKHKLSSESILNLDSNSWLYIDSVYIADNRSLRSSFSRHVFSPVQAYWYTSMLIIMLTLKLHATTVADVNFIFFSYFIKEIYVIHPIANNSYEMLCLVFSAK